MSENVNQFFEETVAHTVDKICLVWLNLSKHVVSFASSEELGMNKKCIGEYLLYWEYMKYVMTRNCYYD